jgi:hypothetical protein
MPKEHLQVFERYEGFSSFRSEDLDEVGIEEKDTLAGLDERRRTGWRIETTEERRARAEVKKKEERKVVGGEEVPPRRRRRLHKRHFPRG